VGAIASLVTPADAGAIPQGGREFVGKIGKSDVTSPQQCGLFAVDGESNQIVGIFVGRHAGTKLYAGAAAGPGKARP